MNSTDLTTAPFPFTFNDTQPADAMLHDAPHKEAPHKEIAISFGLRLTNILVITIPFAGLVLAILLLWGWAFSATHLFILLGMYLATGLGITIGFHRLFTHKSFETNRVVEFILAALGSMAVEGPVFRWVAQHRQHHQHSDEPGDPHSPHLHGEGWRGFIKGLYHSHIGWIFSKDDRTISKYIPDLLKSKTLQAVSKLFPIWVLAGLLIPTLLGGLITLSWSGALLGLLWGGLARIFIVHHVTWSINSVCHIWGSRPYRSHDESRNNLVFGVIGMGEGWHNNHHAFPTSARHGLSWWQVDLSYYIIKAMSWLGLAWKVRVPTAEAMVAKRAVEGPRASPALCETE